MSNKGGALTGNECGPTGQKPKKQSRPRKRAPKVDLKQPGKYLELAENAYCYLTCHLLSELSGQLATAAAALVLTKMRSKASHEWPT